MRKRRTKSKRGGLFVNPFILLNPITGLVSAAQRFSHATERGKV